MPELPEVQTIVDDLKERVIGKRIKNVWTDWPKYFRLPKGETNFKRHIIGKKIIGIERRAKNILFDLSDDHLMLIHQKMSGHLLFGKWAIKKGKWESRVPGPLLTDRNNQYIRLIFFLSGGDMLALSDLRRFAKVLCGPREVILNLPELQKLGPEPLAPQFTFKKFRALFRPSGGAKRGRVKQVLMDPNFISGIGNIYADEILWLAKINPLARVEKMGKSELKAIYEATGKVLRKALKLRGSSIDDYRDALGRRGKYDLTRQVYQREDEPCFRCKTKIKRIKIGGRSAHFCPVCQRLKP
ncbi:MAG: DNA-formamidopyrimidine glycosylase [Patescibacteria group bacterium]